MTLSFARKRPYRSTYFERLRWLSTTIFQLLSSHASSTWISRRERAALRAQSALSRARGTSSTHPLRHQLLAHRCSRAPHDQQIELQDRLDLISEDTVLFSPPFSSYGGPSSSETAPKDTPDGVALPNTQRAAEETGRDTPEDEDLPESQPPCLQASILSVPPTPPYLPIIKVLLLQGFAGAGGPVHLVPLPGALVRVLGAVTSETRRRRLGLLETPKAFSYPDGCDSA